MTYKVGPKGQVVLPKAIRERLGIAPGDEVIVEEGGGEVRIRPARGPVELRGLLRDPGDEVPLTRTLELERLSEIARERAWE